MPSIISARSLCKSFRFSKRRPGLWWELASLFSRHYETTTALKGISFDLQEGEIVGYIGPNGAGKSTTVKILSGILVPDSGEAVVLGKTPWMHRIEIVRQIGVVFGQRTQLLWDLQVIKSFELFKSIYAIPEKKYKEVLDRLIETLDLSKLLHVPVRLLSLGQRMRCDLAASLLHSPRILFLDEPTIGLDAVSKRAMRDFIRYLNQSHQVTILLTTHDLDDIEALCRRVMLLNHGTIYFDGAIADLRRKVLLQRCLVVDLSKEYDTIEDENARLIQRDGHRVRLSFNPMEISAPDLIQRFTSKYAVADLFVEQPPIEEIIAKIYGNNP